MSLTIRGRKDSRLTQVAEALKPYRSQHSKAEIVLYRQNSASIRIRIIDPDFQRVSRGDRHEQVWMLLESLPEDVLGELSILLLLTPQETSKSFANMEFDHPVPSRV